jgi:hypothetical protein
VTYQPEETEYLGAPLLQEDADNSDSLGDLLLSSSPTGISTSASPALNQQQYHRYNNPDDGAMFSQGPMAHPLVRRSLFGLVQLRTAADILPEILEMIVTSGKFSFLGLIGVYLIFLALWLPFWLLSFITSELGIYALAVVVVYIIGRAIIRLIAFPGSSHRVSSEMEKEFAKYSVRMLVASSNSIIDLATALISLSQGKSVSEDGSTNISFYEVPNLWKRAKSYRDRVLAVYAEVLKYLFKGSGDIISPSSQDSDLSKYGNNCLTGDIGDLSGLTTEAKRDGKKLLKLLNSVLDEMDRFEKVTGSILENSGSGTRQLSSGIVMTATNLVVVVSELRDFVESLKPISDAGSQQDDTTGDADDEDLTVDAVRRRFEEQGGSPVDALKSGVASILPMLDPPPHTSIFGFDVQRGCMLSRYRGARQIWVPRPGGGMLDVIHIPAKSIGPPKPRNPKAVLYCNPNAGLIEVAAGMSLAGGNVASDAEGVVNDNCWADYYTNNGFDVYLFNYAGFGRSYGTATCGLLKRGGDEPFHPGLSGRLRRIAHGTFFSFQVSHKPP